MAYANGSVRNFPGKDPLAAAAIRALRALLPRPDLTFPLGRWGGLGNQLFQIAGTYALSEDLGVNVVFRSDWPYRPYFSVPEDWFGARFAVLRCKRAIDYANEIPPEWREYLQDMALWGGREGEISRLLQPTPRALAEAEEAYGDVLALSSKTAVHVRRGDYLDPSMPHLPCPPSYYEAAAAVIHADAPNTRFVVFSDDIDWCRRELPLPDPIFVENNPEWLDLTLMTRCDRHICANSTFSWWGAFLSEDTAPVYPWFRGTLPENFRRIYPAHWRELVLEP